MNNLIESFKNLNVNNTSDINCLIESFKSLDVNNTSYIDSCKNEQFMHTYLRTITNLSVFYKFIISNGSFVLTYSNTIDKSDDNKYTGKIKNNEFTSIRTLNNGQKISHKCSLPSTFFSASTPICCPTKYEKYMSYNAQYIFENFKCNGIFMLDCDGNEHGNAFVKYPNGTTYSGLLKNGKFHGIGTLKYSDGTLYTGEFIDGNYFEWNN